MFQLSLDSSRDKSGPPLNGVVGPDTAAVEGYCYSTALSNSRLNWTEDALDNYLAGPTKLGRGTRTTVSVARVQDRADIIAYLKSLGGQCHSLECLKLPAPIRVPVADDARALLEFALICHAETQVAMATLVEIRDGAARALGSQVVVAADGRYAGYVSGGCVDAAVAFEALLAIEAGQDRVVKVGDGSPFFDIVLPCGGGITIAIHILREPEETVQVLNRQSCGRPEATASGLPGYDPPG